MQGLRPVLEGRRIETVDVMCKGARVLTPTSGDDVDSFIGVGPVRSISRVCDSRQNQKEEHSGAQNLSPVSHSRLKLAFRLRSASSISRLMQRSRVDFPDPDRPMTTRNSPSLTSKLTSLSAVYVGRT